MVRRKTELIISIFILLTCGVIYFFLSSQDLPPADYTLATTEEINEIRSTYGITEENILTDLQFNGEALPSDSATGTFYIPVDMETSEWETGRVTSSQEDVRIVFADELWVDDKQEAIAGSRTYTFLAVQGESYREYRLLFTGLPVMSITTDGVESIRDEEVPGEVKLYEAVSSGDWVWSSQMSAVIRGGTSRQNPKKAYKMTLYQKDLFGTLHENKESLLGMRTDDEWLLYAIYTEGTKVRDKLSIDLWNEIGADIAGDQAHYGTHMEYVELFINGSYSGLYGIMEPIDYKQLDLTKEDSDTGEPEEYLYKQGGYNITEDFELKGQHAELNEEHWEPLNLYNSYREGATDELYAENIGELLDIDSALDVWIYLQAVVGIDNTNKNMYYVARYVENQYKLYFIPWDMDYSWGNVYDVTAANRTIFSEETLQMRVTWDPGQRIIRLDAEGAQERVSAKWKELRENALSDEHICELIDQYSHQVVDSGAMTRDYVWYDSAHNDDYEKLKDLACKRMAFLDYYMEHLDEYLELEAWAGEQS